MIVVTGGAGFIGSNLVRRLNAAGIANILVVDNIGASSKFKNLIGCSFDDYLHKDRFRTELKSGKFDGKISAVFHQGACSNTMELDGNYMLENNFQYSLDLLDFTQREQIQYIYASSAAVYGGGTQFEERFANEDPLNVYGYSKYLFDQIVRKRLVNSSNQIVGLRYFNVYGPYESHKGRMASVAFHFFNQFRANGKLSLFEGSAGYAAGEQRRDFIYVEDVIDVNLYFFENPDKSGIFNCGTGRSQTFNEVAVATIGALKNGTPGQVGDPKKLSENGLIDYVAFPEGLKERYQSFTEASLAALRLAGYEKSFRSVEDGVHAYVKFLLDN
jgi:ADP-L-glycero-D-manno-heptose 6-epimerase